VEQVGDAHTHTIVCRGAAVPAGGRQQIQNQVGTQRGRSTGKQQADGWSGTGG